VVWCAAAEPEVQAQDHVEQHVEPPRIDEVSLCQRQQQTCFIALFCSSPDELVGGLTIKSVVHYQHFPSDHSVYHIISRFIT